MAVLSLVMVVMSSREEVNLLFYLQVNEKGIKLYEEVKNKKIREMALEDLKKKSKKIEDIELAGKKEIDEIDEIEDDDFEHLSIVCKRLITRSAIQKWASYRFAVLTAATAGWIFSPIYLICFTAICIFFLYYLDTTVKHELH